MYAKTLAIIAFTAALGANAAMAQEASASEPIPQHSTLTRAEVREAAIQARAAGLVQHGDATHFAVPTGSSLTRAQVLAETLAAIRVGAISRGEHNSFPTAEQLQSIRMAGLEALTMDTATR